MQNKTGLKLRAADCLLIFAAVCMTLIFVAGVFFGEHADFSPEENRMLSPAPRVSLDSVLRGEFFSDLGKYCSDYVPFRLWLIRLKAVCELAMGKGRNGRVIFLPEGRLVHDGEYDSTALLESNLRGIKALVESSGGIFAAVPRSIDVYLPYESEYLFAATEKIYTEMGEYPMYERLTALSESRMYYKTDHHLDRNGAYALYEYVLQELGSVPQPKEDFEWVDVTTGFCGSAYSDGGAVCTERDTVSLPRYAEDTELAVTCHDDKCHTDALYDGSALDTKDKYSVFLGGNHGRLSVTLQGVDRPHLLIIKDSFANALIPMLARDFDLTVVDPRYYSEELFVHQYDNVVIICGADTLATTPFKIRVS